MYFSANKALLEFFGAVYYPIFIPFPALNANSLLLTYHCKLVPTALAGNLQEPAEDQLMLNLLHSKPIYESN